MKKNKLLLFGLSIALTSMTFLTSCGGGASTETTASAAAEEAPAAGQSAVKDDESQKDLVKVAIGSKDHTTLVTAVQAAELVDVLSNAGPFTVFAPTNEAFNQLPAGTVETLLKPENKEKLQDILQYHVAVAVYKPEMLKDGQVIGMANSGNITISVKDGKTMVNGKATIIGTVNASNGIIHVIDQVLLEDKKQ